MSLEFRRWCYLPSLDVNLVRPHDNIRKSVINPQGSENLCRVGRNLNSCADLIVSHLNAANIPYFSKLGSCFKNRYLITFPAQCDPRNKPSQARTNDNDLVTLNIRSHDFNGKYVVHFWIEHTVAVFSLLLKSGERPSTILCLASFARAFRFCQTKLT